MDIGISTARGTNKELIGWVSDWDLHSQRAGQIKSSLDGYLTTMTL